MDCFWLIIDDYMPKGFKKRIAYSNTHELEIQIMIIEDKITKKGNQIINWLFRGGRWTAFKIGKL